MVLDCTSVWNNCLQFIKANIGEQSFKTWFSPIVPVKLDNNVLTIQVPSQFFYEWLEEHYVQLLRHAIDNELGVDGRLEYSVIVDTGNEANKPYTISLPTQKGHGKGGYNGPNGSSNGSSMNGRTDDFKSPFALKSIDTLYLQSNLNREYTFETYIEGDCNRLARSAGLAVANKPGITSFNPLFIYGDVGLGKTHLVQAIGNDIKQKFMNKFVLYVSSEKFTNQFIDAMKANNIQDFSNYYLQVDILIIDDVQFLAGKEKTQEIFFHIFNHLHQSGKQIIMTSDRAPRNLKGLQDRLLSRFKWGLTADLQQPDFETRIAIIQKKMEADGIDIPQNVIEYLAYSVDTNIRELEGVLISLIAHASLTRKELDLELAKQTLKNIVQEIDTEVSVDFIQKTISEYFHVSLEDMKGKTRKKEIVIARQVAMFFAKEYTNHSLKAIGYHFGGRDHSTVIHAVQTVNDSMEVDSRFQGTMEEIKKKLRMKSV
jgi:chromosomal replication initiator protein